MVTATATELDLNVYPCHALGTWEHALTCQVAGVPVPPESMQALAAHDRHRSPTGRPRGKVTGRRREAVRLVRTGRDLLKAGDVAALDDLVQRITRRAWTRDTAEVQGVLLALTPIGGTLGEDDARPHSPAAGHGLQRTYLDAELFTVSGHYVARGPVALQKFRADHLRSECVDPMAPPTETAPVAVPEPVVPIPEPGYVPATVLEVAPEPAVPSVPEVAALDPVTARVKRSARRVLRDMPGLSLEDLTVEAWVDLDGDVDEPDIVTALETLGYANEPTDERTAA